jgi:hypothetical protein
LHTLKKLKPYQPRPSRHSSRPEQGFPLKKQVVSFSTHGSDDNLIVMPKQNIFISGALFRITKITGQ